MKKALIGLSLIAAPTTLAAQSAIPSQSQDATKASSMGRWDEYRERQEKVSRLDELKDDRYGATKAGSGPEHGMLPKQQVIHDYAACILQKYPEQARSVFGTVIDTQAERAALKSVAALPACSSDRAFISGRSGEFRGALAEMAIHADPARIARIGALAAAVPVRVPIAKGRAFVASYSSCIVSADPAGAMQLLSTQISSPEEKAAMFGMGTALTGCMPEGAKYTVDVRDVRNHIADALYRMSEVPGA
jgi:hypothetical protein